MRLLVLIITFLLLSLPGLAGELFVSSAAGVMELVKEAGRKFENRTGEKLIYNFSSSGKIAKQIEAGAPADVYISASKFWVDYLEKRGALLKGTIKPFATTGLVVVAPKDSEITSLKQAKTVAVGNRFAPVGAYALESLKRLKLYGSLRDRLIYGPTVRQITLWVASGNADAGIIYYSDYFKYRDRLKLIEVLPESSHSPIHFFVACTGRNPEECRKFEKFLLNLPESFYEKFGFKKVK